MKTKSAIRYSESFKLRVVRELEDGRFETITQARRHYGISGTRTIHGWLKEFGKNSMLPKVVRVETPEEQIELKRLRERVKQLEKAVADQFIASEVEKSFLEIACERAGYDDVEEFKKKAGGNRRGGASDATKGSGAS
ncbi:transposase [Puniceicoccus vermicola]